MKTLITLFAMTLSFSTFAYNATPLVACGNHDSAGNVVVDNLNVYRGGNYENQLVIRNKNILNYFIEKGAIYRGELNDKGEFIAAGPGGPMSVSGMRSNRTFHFYKEGSAFILKVGVYSNNGNGTYETIIADFYFNDDCQVLSAR